MEEMTNCSGQDAPILLYTVSGLSELNVQFISENLMSDGTIYILGGDAAVSAETAKKVFGLAADTVIAN